MTDPKTRARINREVRRHAWRQGNKRLLWILGTLYVLLLIVLAMGTDWMKEVGHIVQFTTVLLAFFIWWLDNRRRWEEGLPKRLNADFYYVGSGALEAEPEETKPYRDRIVMRCCGATLSGEADIRAWGQQLGAQMMDGDRGLSLSPDTRITHLGIQEKEEEEGGSGRFYLGFRAEFFLTRLPKAVLKKAPIGSNGQFSPVECGGRVPKDRLPAAGADPAQ